VRNVLTPLEPSFGCGGVRAAAPARLLAAYLGGRRAAIEHLVRFGPQTRCSCGAGGRATTKLTSARAGTDFHKQTRLKHLWKDPFLRGGLREPPRFLGFI
jgi:hypothetical protein